MSSHPDLSAEQAYIDRAYERLEAMRRAAADLRDSVIGEGRGGTHQARVERDVFVQTSLARLEQLELGRASLVFGRIDRSGDDGDGSAGRPGDRGYRDSPRDRGHLDGDRASDNGHLDGDGPRDNGRRDGDRSRDDGRLDGDRASDDGRRSGDDVERFYIGRLAVSDEQQEPLVVDWRAPVAEAFYRATGRSPMGLRLRRHFATEGRRLLAIEDELFAVDGGGEPDDLVGPGALLAALQRSRSGQMRDIVATVQREQDEVIRADLPGVLVVQGGPGTGKTAVALHRAAYLLYTYRFPLEQQGVLVIGPNQVFLRYIEQVLPSLGESGVALSTLGGLVPGARPRAVEAAATNRVKGDARMAEVLARAVADRERGLRQDLVLGFGSLTVRARSGATRAIAGSVRRRPGTHNARRRQLETMLLRTLHDNYLAALGRARRSMLAPEAVDDDGGELAFAEFSDQARRAPEVVEALERMWPLLAPEDLLNDLYGAPALLASATQGLFTDAERDALARPRAKTLEEVRWATGDVPLLDEARALLGPLRARRGDDDQPRGYGHIIVDEAQDLSPMALRMLGRRSISGSMTLVGDLGQATAGWAPASWAEVLRHLPARRPPRVVALSVNYRTPAEIMDVAAEVLLAASTDAVVPRSVRATGRVPGARQVAPGSVPASVAAVVGELVQQDGTIGVIGSAADLPDLAPALDAAGIIWGDPEQVGLTEQVTLLDVPSVKGLEFDAVVVAEPAAIVDESGLRALFVAVTRPTRELTAVHARPLPDALVRGLQRARSRPAEGLEPLNQRTAV
jgi:DNA helicase IV